MTESMKQARPGGRTERNTLAVARAVLQELQAGNFDFKVSDIAERAGVNQSTVYRRWPNKTDMMREALAHHTRKIRLPDTGSWEKDLKRLISELVKFFSNPVELAINQALITDPSKDLELNSLESWGPMFEIFSEPIQRAQARGEISDAYDATTLLQLVLSPILLSVLVTKKPLSRRYSKELFDTFLLLTAKKPSRSKRSKERR